MRLTDAPAALSLAQSAEQQSRQILHTDSASPGAKFALAESLNVQADCLWRCSDFAHAKEVSEKARGLFSELGDKQGQAQAFNSIGIASYFLGDFSQARRFHECSLKLRRDLHDTIGEIQSLNNLGSVRLSLGKYEDARRCFNQALALQESLTDKSLLVLTYNNLGAAAYRCGDYREALHYYRQSLLTAELLSNRMGELNALLNIGGVQTDLGDYAAALESLTASLALAQTLRDTVREAETFTNIGLLQIRLCNFDQAIAAHAQSRDLHRKVGNKAGEALAQYNLGDTYRQMNDFDKAREIFSQAIGFAKSSGDKLLEAHTLNRLGQTDAAVGNYPQALAHYEQCLALRRGLGDKAGAAECLLSIGELYSMTAFAKHDFSKSAARLTEALTLAYEIGAKDMIHRILKALYGTAKLQGNTVAALDYHERFYDVERDVFSQENRRKLTQLEVQHQTELIVREKAMMRREQELTDKLLENILPASIIRRLKQGTKPIAERVPEATVLFSDIVHFTRLAAKTPPEQLVGWLNQLFSLFDSLVERNGLEKIKTIGDAYMVVGGLPEPRADHAEAAAQLALEMLAALKKFNEKHQLGIDLRIGIHSGEVVAGVIGTKKLAYDLWGDTVNIAWHLQTHGVDGTIQVSDAVCRRLRGKFLFRERGEQEVKGKGLMTTYFLTGKAHHAK